jgi:S-formylglutathione hydrolase FrmB
MTSSQDRTNQWRTVTLAGHPCDTFEPTRRNEHGYIAIYLHGVHEQRLRDYPAFGDCFENHGLPVVCPSTRRSWWSDRICPEFDERFTAERYLLDHVLPYVEEEYGSAPLKIGLLGTSMGGQGALRFSFKYPHLFPVVAGISPAIDYHVRWREGDETLPHMYSDQEATRQDTAILHVHPLNWPRHLWFSCDPADEKWWPSAERLQMKLSALGIPHVCDLDTSGGGHGFEYYGRMAPVAIGHLANALERERLRVI